MLVLLPLGVVGPGVTDLPTVAPPDDGSELLVPGVGSVAAGLLVTVGLAGLATFDACKQRE